VSWCHSFFFGAQKKPKTIFDIFLCSYEVVEHFALRNTASMGVSNSVTGSGLQPPPQIRKNPRESSDEDEDDINQSNPFSKTSKSIPSPLPKVKTESSSHLFPSLLSSGLLKWSLGAITTLYILNQQHLLPKPLSAIVSKTLFWPTLPITVSRRLGSWSTVIDDTVVLGGAPFGFAKIPHKLHDEYNVAGVINMCEEYRGPTKIYDALGMEELWLPTTDHFEPSVNDMKVSYFLSFLGHE
jgi:hypothetical protein